MNHRKSKSAESVPDTLPGEPLSGLQNTERDETQTSTGSRNRKQSGLESDSKNEQRSENADSDAGTSSTEDGVPLKAPSESKEEDQVAKGHAKDDTPSDQPNIPVKQPERLESVEEQDSTHHKEKSPPNQVNLPLKEMKDHDSQDEFVGRSEDEEPKHFTIDDAVNAGGYRKFQKLLTFLAGLGWLADAFEIIILSLIGDMVACDWPMQRWQNALMSSIVFFGMMLGAPTFGHIADLYGRKIYYWAVGAIGVVVAAWIIMKFLDNWRVFLFLAAIPALIVVFTMKWYPESARFYLVSNQKEKALSTLQRLIKMNKAEMPKGTLINIDADQQRAKFRDLFSPAMRRSTLLFCYIWWAVAMTYYGIALVSPNIVAHGSLLETSRQIGNKSFLEDFTEKMECKKFTDAQFFNLLWTTAAEFPGIIVFTFAVEHVERKVFLGTTCICVAFLTLFLQLEIKPKIALLFVLFICRALITGIFQLLFIMTTEAFPTTLRASAMGTGSGCARLAGVIVPVIAQVVVIARPVIAIFFLSAVACLAGIAAFLLPLETRGVEMQECAE